MHWIFFMTLSKLMQETGAHQYSLCHTNMTNFEPEYDVRNGSVILIDIELKESDS